MEREQGLPLVHTKWVIPPLRSGVVKRSRLVEQINRALQQGDVIVSAPPGYGKTTLLVEWALQSALPVAWLSLDAQDNDLQLFFNYLTRALQNVVPDLMEKITGYGSAISTTRAFFSGLTGLINELGDQDLALALDDYHTIHNEVIHDGVRFLLDHQPAGLHLVISGRVDPPLGLARLRARGRLDELRPAQLRFNSEETRQFIQQTMGLALSADQIDQLERKTEGWVTGLQLAALSAGAQVDPRKLADAISGEHSYLFDYLIEEVFEQQAEDIRQFLLRTSILNSLTGPLCDALLAHSDARLQNGRRADTRADMQTGRGQAILHRLYHANMFLTSLDRQEHWFRYHPLFAEALRRLLRERLADEAPQLHRRACDWYAENHFPEEAIQHALEAGDMQRAVSIIETNAEEVMKNGGILTLLRWLRLLPEEMARESPLLCVVYAWGLTLVFETDAAEKWIAEAMKKLPPNGAAAQLPGKTYERRRLVGLAYAVQSMIAAARGDGRRSVELSHEALDLLPDDNPFLRSFLSFEQSVSDQFRGDLRVAEQNFRQTVHLSQLAGNWMVMMIARCNLGEIQAARGKLTEALTTLRQALALNENPEGKPMGFIGHLYIEIGKIFMERNELEQAMTYLSQGASLCRQWLPMLIELDAHMQLACLKQRMGDIAGAQEELALCRKISDATDVALDDVTLGAHEAKLALLRGDVRQALTWAQTADLLDEDGAQEYADFPFSLTALLDLNLARLWLALGRQDRDAAHFAQALGILQTLSPRLIERDCVSLQIETLTLQALARQEMGEMERALDCLRQALAMAEPEGYRRIFLDEGLPLSRLMARLLALDRRNGKHGELPTREFIAELLKQFSYPAGETPAGRDQPPEPPPPAGDERIIELLTPRETEVLRLAGRGLSNAEIARQLVLSLNTVKRHLNSVFQKLGVTTRLQAVRVARQLGLIE